MTKEEHIEYIRNELFRMECAYDNLFTDSNLYRTYENLKKQLRGLTNADVV